MRYPTDIQMQLIPTVVEQTHRGERVHASVVIHQPLAGFRGQATDIEIHAKQILKTKETLNELYAKHTGQPVDKIARDTDRDNFMSAEEARTYGVIDEVLTTLKRPRTP